MAIRGSELDLDVLLGMLSLPINWKTMKNATTTRIIRGLPLGNRDFRYEAIIKAQRNKIARFTGCTLLYIEPREGKRRVSGC